MLMLSVILALLLGWCTGGRLSRVLKFQIPASSIKPAVSVS